MKVKSRNYKITIVCETNHITNDVYFLTSETGTWETNNLLMDMGLGFKNYQSVYYYAKVGKQIPVNGTIFFLNSAMSLDYIKGLCYWSNHVDRSCRGRFFQSCKTKNDYIEKGREFYKSVSIQLS